jgi:hypothetical protein
MNVAELIAILSTVLITPAVIFSFVYKIKKDKHDIERLKYQKEILELEVLKQANEEPRSKLLGSSLERKFIILAWSIPRVENRFTTFSVVINFPEQAPEYGPRLPIK